MEMTLIKINDATTTGSTLLDNAITRIMVSYKRANGATQDIAKELYNIKSKELYKAINAEYTFSDFVEEVLKISKSKASRLCNIAKRFLICTEAEEEEVNKKYGQYNISQLTEMLSASDEMLDYITPEMTSIEIRDYIKGAKQITDKRSEQENPEQNSAEQNSAEPEQNSAEQNSAEPEQNSAEPEQYYIDTDIAITKEEVNSVYGYQMYDDSKTVIADDYTIYINSSNEVVSATCNSIKGLKNVHTWINKNKTQIIKSFNIRFEVAENEQ